jgi:hypothetical protein
MMMIRSVTNYKQLFPQDNVAISNPFHYQENLKNSKKANVQNTTSFNDQLDT